MRRVSVGMGAAARAFACEPAHTGGRCGGGAHRRIDRDLEAPVHDRMARRREGRVARRAGARASPRAARGARAPRRRSRPRPRERATCAAASSPSARTTSVRPRPAATAEAWKTRPRTSLRAAAREALRRSCRAGGAESLDGAGRARGSPGRADLLAEIHERRGEVAGIPRRQERGDASAQGVGVARRAGLPGDREEARDDARHVGVERRDPGSEGERRRRRRTCSRRSPAASRGSRDRAADGRRARRGSGARPRGGCARGRSSRVPTRPRGRWIPGPARASADPESARGTRRTGRRPPPRSSAGA